MKVAPDRLTRSWPWQTFASSTFRARFISTCLFVVFAVVCGAKLIGWVSRDLLAIDLRIYRAAAEAGLRGDNPWSVVVDGFYFAGPPPTLLISIPAALMPEQLAIVAYSFVFGLAAVLAVRALELPLWWVLFPPLFESILTLNPDVLVLALLLGGPLAGGLAVVAKVYAAVPLILQRKWLALAVGGLLSLASLPWWVMYLENRSTVLDVLSVQAQDLSAWGTWLMVPTVIALFILRRRGAEWLVVPGLWPSTQVHYATIALPAARNSPLLAFLLCFTVPLLPPLAIIAEACRVVLLERLRARRAKEST